MKILITAAIILLFSNAVLSQKKTVAKPKDVPTAKKIVVFTTAENTVYRLTATFPWSEAIGFVFGLSAISLPLIFTIEPVRSLLFAVP